MGVLPLFSVSDTTLDQDIVSVHMQRRGWMTRSHLLNIGSLLHEQIVEFHSHFSPSCQVAVCASDGFEGFRKSWHLRLYERGKATGIAASARVS